MVPWWFPSFVVGGLKRANFFYELQDEMISIRCSWAWSTYFPLSTFISISYYPPFISLSSYLSLNKTKNKTRLSKQAGSSEISVSNSRSRWQMSQSRIPKNWICMLIISMTERVSTRYSKILIQARDLIDRNEIQLQSCRDLECMLKISTLCALRWPSQNSCHDVINVVAAGCEVCQQILLIRLTFWLDLVVSQHFMLNWKENDPWFCSKLFSICKNHFFDS